MTVWRERTGWAVALGGLVVLMVVSLGLGRYRVPPSELLSVLLGRDGGMPDAQRALLHAIVLATRLPRVAGAVIVGAALSVSGAGFQAVFRNPLVSPGLLGVLAGAGFGAAFGIVAGASPMGLHLLSFAGGAVAVVAAVGVARLFDAASMLMLVFGGLVSTALFTALLSLLKYVADPDKQLPDIVFWLLGSLTQVTGADLGVMAGPVAVGIVGLTLCGRMLDALAMGDDEARTLGVPVEALRYGVIAAATVLSAVTVSVAGMIGWVGLIVPHVARLLAGPCNARVLPLSACLGGAFLLVCDDLARCVSVEEIPVGLVADLFGVGVFLSVLRLIRRGWVE
ncbi:FecCD family ABC transporter permease [Gluconacetobacter sacchari]|uniref:Iron ABC transporter permease n=2 Tax=Gluconacetobacter sacchari TaxID=92759 RepID=A0A7W4IEM1_9PROT|nr:iron ABC transporter permease [Gluconacetobacter sacchari]MBB2161439.1 iron ABC transporter permease [Gluconacetobacter sacchari]GBQ26124.1 Fe3+-siderophore ABC transporter permease [Gluconacetobacter sacchari DSM 12717]